MRQAIQFLTVNLHVMLRCYALRFGLCALLGALLNVPVAWFCLLEPHEYPQPSPSANRRYPIVIVNRQPPNAVELAHWREIAPRGMSEPFLVQHSSGFGYEL